jgi:tryptophan synthase alpha chain
MSAAVAPRTRFDHAFADRTAEHRPGLIPYVTAGFPTVGVTASLLMAAQKGGAIAAELGIPFSDPLADGPTIQRAGWRALQNGMTLGLAIEQVRQARLMGVTLPLAAMTYVNPVLAYGIERFAQDARDAGLDGLIVPDLPDDEASGIRDTVHGAGLALIPLVAPTTPRERLVRIAEHGAGFIYCVSVTGVTGARDALAPEALQLLELVRDVSRLPVALGFGLSTPAHLRALTGRADAAVVGSALIDAIDRGRDDAAAVVEGFCRSMLET